MRYWSPGNKKEEELYERVVRFQILLFKIFKSAESWIIKITQPFWLFFFDFLMSNWKNLNYKSSRIPWGFIPFRVPWGFISSRVPKNPWDPKGNETPWDPKGNKTPWDPRRNKTPWDPRFIQCYRCICCQSQPHIKVRHKEISFLSTQTKSITINVKIKLEKKRAEEHRRVTMKD